MIGTIGSLVQATSSRSSRVQPGLPLRAWPWVWLLATSLYTAACVAAASLLGALLGLVGHLALNAASRLGLRAPLPNAACWLLGALALAYAASDLGWPTLPRPHLRDAVPITWWRRWRPYGAALAYGASLGVGFMTRIPFGAFYVICAWVILRGDPLFGALLLGVYGAARALVMYPASAGVYRHRAHLVDWLSGPLFDVDRAQELLAMALFAFGATILLTATLAR